MYLINDIIFTDLEIGFLSCVAFAIMRLQSADSREQGTLLLLVTSHGRGIVCHYCCFE